MLKTIGKFFFGSVNDRLIKKTLNDVAVINSIEPEIQSLSDNDLNGKTNYFK